MTNWTACLLLLLLHAGIARGEGGVVQFAPEEAAETNVPERFRLDDHRFEYQMQSVETTSTKMRIFDVTFPSPVETPHVNNNTVHCEYYRPLDKGPHAGVVVLHILGGDFDLSRLFCRAMAHNGSCALFVKMPYYGPRRQPDSPARMVSLDPAETVRGMTQAVLDIRRGTAWLADRDEVNPQQLGIFGISLGGITGALAATAEPRLKNVCLMLAGGDVGVVGWESKEMSRLRKQWVANGGTRQGLIEALRPVDPVTYGANVHGRRILLMNARYDEVIPPSCSESLWRAFGKPPIHWYDSGHYSAGRFLFDGVARATRFFQRSP